MLTDENCEPARKGWTPQALKIQVISLEGI